MTGLKLHQLDAYSTDINALIEGIQALQPFADPLIETEVDRILELLQECAATITCLTLSFTS